MNRGAMTSKIILCLEILFTNFTLDKFQVVFYQFLFSKILSGCNKREHFHFIKGLGCQTMQNTKKNTYLWLQVLETKQGSLWMNTETEKSWYRCSIATRKVFAWQCNKIDQKLILKNNF